MAASCSMASFSVVLIFNIVKATHDIPKRIYFIVTFFNSIDPVNENMKIMSTARHQRKVFSNEVHLRIATLYKTSPRNRAIAITNGLMYFSFRVFISVAEKNDRCWLLSISKMEGKVATNSPNDHNMQYMSFLFIFLRFLGGQKYKKMIRIPMWTIYAPRATASKL